MSGAYSERTVGAALDPWIECCWTIHASALLDYAVTPDGCLDIVYSREMGLLAIGAMPFEQRFTLTGGSSSLGLRFRPGMAGKFLGVAPAELTGASLRLEDLWGASARRLQQQLSETSSAADRGRLLTAALRRPAGGPGPVQRAIAAITAAHGWMDIDWAASQAGMSARQFRRRCLEESGLTPKHLCRILRFRRARDLAVHSKPDWAAIAIEAGYFDQAHLIRDFRAFTGHTPGNMPAIRPG